MDVTAEADENAKAMWLLDKVAKNFLVWLPSEPAQFRPFSAPVSGVGGLCNRMWNEWVAKEPSVNGLSHRRRNFFVVRCGCALLSLV